MGRVRRQLETAAASPTSCYIQQLLLLQSNPRSARQADGWTPAAGKIAELCLGQLVAAAAAAASPCVLA